MLIFDALGNTMKTILKTIIAAVALSSSLAMAQSYSEAVRKQRFCSNVGHGWAEVWEYDTLGDKTVKQMSQDKEAGKLDHESFMALYMLYLKASVRTKGMRSAHDAYMAGWANCMDEK